uniref:EGF-like domain-containing protein n=1 Tax=Anopheles atroparvus TaxID=41427 RepID=A0AAG5DQC9_ANOAO
MKQSCVTDYAIRNHAWFRHIVPIHTHEYSVSCRNVKEVRNNRNIINWKHPSSESEVKRSSAAIDFYKFLVRFTGRRRVNKKKLHKLYNRTVSVLAMFLIFSSALRMTDGCSSRTTPKPRPPSSTPRPNITFHTYKCPPAYAAWYCLNDATCFTVKIGDSLLYNCECADGYMGPRCEYKDLDGSYLPTRPRVMLETASIASGAIGSLVLIMIGWCCWCVRRHQRHKKLEKENGVDTVDAPGILQVVHSQQLIRPFGTHHLKTIPMSEALMR